MKLVKWHKTTINNLHTELVHLFREQFSLKMQFSTGKLKKNHMLRVVRKKIARIKTIITLKSKDHV
ncbi:50S ribosomal protein L29 [Buchnera aphidicola]|uniref:Large ribosomal subunit protein uL29 n=1 Tax=Buchnera aphidicola (Sarucallis kahawaluokalani) TaxID=1241878 RepID=A0A4D6Y874_9GAMM|nr:50S ribosomal protein L29 [Buchnera aphidicola]QCI26126.1 50S ribosomal protein L29 [Buchnera aphidicola (Sarucallis kahawaluokalani)]